LLIKSGVFSGMLLITSGVGKLCPPRILQQNWDLAAHLSILNFRPCSCQMPGFTRVSRPASLFILTGIYFKKHNFLPLWPFKPVQLHRDIELFFLSLRVLTYIAA
jgi:hypothetical protein